MVRLDAQSLFDKKYASSATHGLEARTLCFKSRSLHFSIAHIISSGVAHIRPKQTSVVQRDTWASRKRAHTVSEAQSLGFEKRSNQVGRAHNGLTGSAHIRFLEALLLGSSID